MRSVAPVFQVYRLVGHSPVSWRLISPNGRGLARSTADFLTPDEARASIVEVVAAADRLVPTMRLTTDYRWRWELALDERTVVQGVGDNDRRVRCEHAWRKFVLLAPIVDVDPTTYTFRRGDSTEAQARRSQPRHGSAIS